MDRIGVELRPYRQQLRLLSLALSCVKLLRGIGILMRQRLESESDGVSIKPLLGAMLMSVLGMRLAQMKDDQTMFTINSTSLALNMTYLFIFYMYASPDHKTCIWRRTVLILVLISICLVYSLLAEEEDVKRDLGIVMTATTSLLIVLGLLNETGCLGCLISLVVVTSKLLYALSMQQKFMIYQSLLIFGLDVLRIVINLIGSSGENLLDPEVCPYCNRCWSAHCEF